MDTYENDPFHQENEYSEFNPGGSPEPQQNAPQTDAGYTPQQPYSGAGVGRKESPFADSPYVMNHAQPNTGYQGGYQYNPYTPPVPPQEPPKARKKRGGKVWKPILAGVLTLALVAGGCGITALVVNNRWEAQTEQMTASFNQKLDAMQQQIDSNSIAASGTSVSGSPVSSAEGLTPSQVYAQNVDSVVLISSEVTSTSVYGQTTGTATGSGFILTSDGYVVTNHHVIDGANSVTVSTSDAQQYTAEIVGSDSTNDVALLKVNATDLPAVTVGSSDALIVGDQVVAIGNPLGELTSTMTVGYVSAKDRDVTTDGTTINMLQTDVAINSGNSGGPLFNMKGEVVGITTAKYSGSSASGATIEGIGFAIPIDDVSGIIDSLRQYGYVTGAYLGVLVRPVDSDTASMYGLPMGSYVESVTAGSCAEAAGVQAKDIIIGLGGYDVESNTDLTRALRKFEAGDTTTIRVYRGGQELTLTITLDEKPHEDAASSEAQEPTQGQMPQDGSYEDWYNYFAPFFGNGNG
ncbi:MAG: trypsin-like peptidase domain-containing protein [Oscillospiraceae bacterium]|nr:trypsin-like peptidase domain-containing protein [Oscillospiraceae bacterium]